MSTEKDKRDFVQSLARGLEVIQAFGPERPEMTLSDVAKQTGMTRAAARRFLLTLERLGYVGSDGRHFTLRPQVLNLGYVYLSMMPWWRIAQPYMEDAAGEVHESCSASVLDGAEIVYVARVPSSRIMTINLSIGSRLPAFATSMGRVLMAHEPPERLDAFFRDTKLERLTDRTVTDEQKLRKILAAVRKQGYCLVDQELETGLRSLAVPITDRRGQVLAAMNMSAHAARVKKSAMIDTYLPALLRASNRITQALPQ